MLYLASKNGRGNQVLNDQTPTERRSTSDEPRRKVFGTSVPDLREPLWMSLPEDEEDRVSHLKPMNETNEEKLITCLSDGDFR